MSSQEVRDWERRIVFTIFLFILAVFVTLLVIAMFGADQGNGNTMNMVCVWCGEELLVTEFNVDGLGNPIHKECMMRMTIGSVGHMLQLCSCYGGNEEDPPNMTRRQAAQAAVMLFFSDTDEND